MAPHKSDLAPVLTARESLNVLGIYVAGTSQTPQSNPTALIGSTKVIDVLHHDQPTFALDSRENGVDRSFDISLLSIGGGIFISGIGILLWYCRNKRLKLKNLGKPITIDTTAPTAANEDATILIGAFSNITTATSDNDEPFTPAMSTGELVVYAGGNDVPSPGPLDAAVLTPSPLHSPAQTLIDSQEEPPEVEASPAGGSPLHSPGEDTAADAERRHAALLEMLAHEPLQLWRPRRRRRTADGGLRMNGTGPRNGPPSPTSTTTTFLTDDFAESVITLPPRYAEYGSRAPVSGSSGHT